MPSILTKNIFTLGKHHNYVVGGNVCNAFVLGELGSQDDFFLIGAEPRGEGTNPLLTGNILDSEGHLLARVVGNGLTINPQDFIKLVDTEGGFEIQDRNGVRILKAMTRVEQLAGIPQEYFVTTMWGNFYDRSGTLVFNAHGGDGEEYIESSRKAAFGFNTVFDYVQGYTDDELEVAKTVLTSGGAMP